MQRKTPLKTGKPLARRAPLKKAPAKPKQRLKLEQKSAQQLRKPADEFFSKYVRLRDSERRGDEWHGQCITCSKQGTTAWIDETGKLRFVSGWDAGHFISRGNTFLRYDEENVNLQCAFHCNKMKSGNLEKYKPALDAKYGEGTWLKLSKVAQDNKVYSLKKPELLQIISDSKAQIAFIQSH